MLPYGRYKGIVLPPFGFFNRIWSGKVFAGHKVKNIIRGKERIEGEVWRSGDKVIINYPQLNLKDEMTLDKDGSTWNGTMNLFGVTVKFTLTKE